MSRRDAVLAALLAAVNGDLPDGIPETALEHMFDFEVDQLPSSTLFAVREPVVVPAGLGERAPVRVRSLELQFEVRAAAAEGISARAATGPITDHLTARLGGNRLANTVQGVEETHLEWLYEGEDLAYCTAIALYTVTYQTRVNDASLRA